MKSWWTVLALPFLMASDCFAEDPATPRAVSLDVRWAAVPGCPPDSTVRVILTKDETNQLEQRAPCTARSVVFRGLEEVSYAVSARLISAAEVELTTRDVDTGVLEGSSEADAATVFNSVSLDLLVPEICDDPAGADDNGDGNANCGDVDCAQDPACIPAGAPMASFPNLGGGRPKLFRDPFKPGRYVMVGFGDGHVATFDSGLGLPFTASGGVALTGATVADAKPAGSGSLRVVGQHANTAYVAKLTSANDATAGLAQFVYGPTGLTSDARAFVPSAGGNVVIGNVVDTTTKISVALFDLAFTNLQVYSVISDGVSDWNVVAAAPSGSDNVIVGTRGFAEAAFVVRGQGQIQWQTLLKANTSIAIELDNVVTLANGDVAAVGIEVLQGGAQVGLVVVLEGATGEVKLKRTFAGVPLTAIAAEPTGNFSVGGAFQTKQVVAQLSADGVLMSVFSSTQPAERMSLALDSDNSRITGAFGQDTAFVSHDPSTTCSYDLPVGFPADPVDSDAIEQTPALTSIQAAASIGAASAVPIAQNDVLTAVCP